MVAFAEIFALPLVRFVKVYWPVVFVVVELPTFGPSRILTVAPAIVPAAIDETVPVRPTSVGAG